MIPSQLAQAIQTAKQECKDPYAKAYLGAIDEAVLQGGIKGLQVQLRYCLANMSSWRGDTARATKQVFKAHS